MIFYQERLMAPIRSSHRPRREPPKVLITAGPTHEPIDQVRYVGNRSSGRMGIALAQAAIARGWPTTLALGPTELQPPNGSHLRTIRFQTAAQLEALLREQWPTHDVLLMAAAVADYRPAIPAGSLKIKRGERPLTIELEPTPDLLLGLAEINRPGQLIIGFALEPQERLLESARRKLQSKRLHAIVANPLETMGSP